MVFPSLLVIGTLPTFPIINKDVTTQKERMDSLRSEREGVAIIRVQQRLSKMIRANLSPAA